MQTGHPTIILLSRGSCMPSYSPFLDVSILCIFYLQCMFEPVVSLFFFQFQIDYLRIFLIFLWGRTSNLGCRASGPYQLGWSYLFLQVLHGRLDLWEQDGHSEKVSKSHVMYLALSLLQKWSVLVKEVDRKRIAKVKEETMDWMKGFKPSVMMPTDI